MYLRIVKVRNKGGELVEYYQLAHNVRHPESGRPVAKVLYSLGRSDCVAQADLLRLAKSISRVCEVKGTQEGGAGGEPTTTHQACHDCWRRESPLPLPLEAAWELLQPEAIVRTLVGGESGPHIALLLKQAVGHFYHPQHGFFLPLWGCLSCRKGSANRAGLELLIQCLSSHGDRILDSLVSQAMDQLSVQSTRGLYQMDRGKLVLNLEDDDHLGNPGIGEATSYKLDVRTGCAVNDLGFPVRSRLYFDPDQREPNLLFRSELPWEGLTDILRVLQMEEVGQEVESLGDPFICMIPMVQALASVKERYLVTRLRRLKGGSPHRVGAEHVGPRAQGVVREFFYRDLLLAGRQRRRRTADLVQWRVIMTNSSTTMTGHTAYSWLMLLKGLETPVQYLKMENGSVEIDQGAVEDVGKFDGAWVVSSNSPRIRLEDLPGYLYAHGALRRVFHTMDYDLQRISTLGLRPNLLESFWKVKLIAMVVERMAKLRSGQPLSSLLKGSPKEHQ